MEQVFIQILAALGLLFGGGVLVKLYEIFRARNASDNEQLVRHYQTLLADERKEHARVVAELWARCRYEGGGLMAKQIILIVEDDIILASLFKSILEEEGGYECEVVDSLAEAKKRVTLSPPLTCILLDLKLPNGAGMELVNELDRHTPTIPIVVVTGFSVTEKAVKEAGGQAMLQKPVSKSELVSTVKQVVKEWHGDRPSKLDRSFAALEADLKLAYERAKSKIP